MTATNHALTGALVGFTLTTPWLAVPAALLSHLVLDAIPHFGFKNTALNSRLFKGYLGSDALLASLVLGTLVLSQPTGWVVAFLCAFVAMAPDLMWLPDYLRSQRGTELKEHRHIVLFHKRIQWFERPAGFIVEGAWLILVSMLLLPYF